MIEENERAQMIRKIASAIGAAQTIKVSGAEIVVLPKLIFDQVIAATEILLQPLYHQPQVKSGQPNLNPEALLTAKEVADEWGVTTAALEKWRFTGEGPTFIKLGMGNKARVRYRRQDIADYIAGCKKQNTA